MQTNTSQDQPGPLDFSDKVIVIGAGPAGLTAARELAKHNIESLVLERNKLMGGIARTEYYKGFRFDIGGHRFYTTNAEVEAMWHEVLGKDLLERPRLSRIYYNRKFFPYPIQLIPTLRQLGIVESIRILASYLAFQLFPHREENTFAEWVSNRFGRRLYQTFFKSYTEKVWGISTTQLSAEWAAQRIKGLSLRSAVTNALPGQRKTVKSLINTFLYPKEGPGMLWEAVLNQLQEHPASGVMFPWSVVRLIREGNQIVSIRVVSPSIDSPLEQVPWIPKAVISTMSLQSLVLAIEPPPPDAVLAAAQGLNYRAFILVGLIVQQKEIFPDNWIYIHEPAVQVGRIQNFRNWSPYMLPHPSWDETALGMEYFCNEGDALWEMADDDLIALASKEVVQLGLVDAADIIDGVVFRQPKAYPVYDATYRQHVETIRDYLSEIENLQTIGRNGLHRYNNQDHSMLTGLLAARNIVKEQNGEPDRHDLWAVNTERSYYEKWTVKS